MKFYLKNKKCIFKKYFLSYILIIFLCIEPSLVEANSAKNSVLNASQSFTSIADKAIPAVVNINTLKTIRGRSSVINPFYEMFFDDFSRGVSPGYSPEYKQKGLGSGVLISKDGYILTNYHVVEKVDEINVTLSDNREFKAKIIGKDKKTEIALLKISGKDLPTLKFGDSDLIKVGDWAIAVGNPFGLSGTMTVGIISAKGRSDEEIASHTSFIQTDAAINPGNSGGALLNIKGELIGINTAIISKSGGYMGIGFAIPVNMAKRVIKDLKESGHVKRGWLGVYIQPVDKSLQRMLSLPHTKGALVNDVIKNSPADKAGLKRGDFITKVKGQSIQSFKSLQAKIGELEIGEKVQIEFVRNKKTKKVIVKIESVIKKISDFNKTLGLNVADITPELVKKFALNSNYGVVVESIQPNSLAFRSNLQTGDIILEINEKSVFNKKEFQKIIQSIPKNTQVLILLNRNGITYYDVIE